MNTPTMTRLRAFLLTAVILFGTLSGSFAQLVVDTDQVSIEVQDDRLDHASLYSQDSDTDAVLASLLSLAEKSETDNDEVGFQNTSFTKVNTVPTFSFEVLDHFTSCLLVESKKYILYHSLKIPC